MHARIRNKCSNLSHYLFINHLSPNPFCSCNREIENAEQFFFRCPKYLNERVILFRETRFHHPLNINKFLICDIFESIETDNLIFKAVHNFIKITKIFRYLTRNNILLHDNY